MSLWTPYADEALDLTKGSVKLQISQQPVPQPNPPYQYYVPTKSPVQYPFNGYELPQMSPSSSLGYEDYIQYQRTALSPPDSPETDHSKQSLIRLSNRVDSEFLMNDPEYQAFERDALRAMAEKNGGTLLGNNPRMRRSVRSTKEVDDGYRKQRERNNFAAKQSRDRRKLREVRLALKVTYLEKEAAKLKALLASGKCVRCNYRC